VDTAGAGDAGHSLAAVAEEVRALALRSAEASKSIADRIERGALTAQRGVFLNGEVLQSLETINQYIVRVAEVTHETSLAVE